MNISRLAGSKMIASKQTALVMIDEAFCLYSVPAEIDLDIDVWFQVIMYQIITDKVVVEEDNTMTEHG